MNAYKHRLKFYIDPDTPDNFRDKWEELKVKCEDENIQNIVKQIKLNCTLEQNKNLPYLDSVEGGLGGDNIQLYKQIRFRVGYDDYHDVNVFANDDYIILDQITESEAEKWRYEELDDLIQAFIKVAEIEVGLPCINGCIELIKN